MLMNIIIDHYFIQTRFKKKKMHSVCPLWKWVERSKGNPCQLCSLSALVFTLHTSSAQKLGMWSKPSLYFISHTGWLAVVPVHQKRPTSRASSGIWTLSNDIRSKNIQMGVWRNFLLSIFLFHNAKTLTL